MSEETIGFKGNMIYHRREWLGVQLEEPAEEKEELQKMVPRDLKTVVSRPPAYNAGEGPLS